MEAKKVILAVDDMAVNLRTIKLALEKDFDMRLAKSGEFALAILAVQRVDLILLDLEMPGMSGLEFMKILKSNPRGAGIPVIFVSARTAPELSAGTKEFGAAGHVIKPFEPGALRQKIHEVLGIPPVPG